jgi:hypothetical protein
MTRETVAMETPAWAATSFIVKLEGCVGFWGEFGRFIRTAFVNVYNSNGTPDSCQV